MHFPVLRELFISELIKGTLSSKLCPPQHGNIGYILLHRLEDSVTSISPSTYGLFNSLQCFFLTHLSRFCPSLHHVPPDLFSSRIGGRTPPTHSSLSAFLPLSHFSLTSHSFPSELSFQPIGALPFSMLSSLLNLSPPFFYNFISSFSLLYQNLGVCCPKRPRRLLFPISSESPRVSISRSASLLSARHNPLAISFIPRRPVSAWRELVIYHKKTKRKGSTGEGHKQR